MKKITEKLRGVSVAGRIAFIIMCIEKYIVAQYPEKDWTPLAEEMWKFNDSYWDEWLDSFVDLFPEYINEYNEFEDYAGKYSRDTFRNLYKDLKNNDVNKLLNLLDDFMGIYLYTRVWDGTESMFPKVIEEIVSYLTKNNIPIPDVEKVSFSDFGQNDGFGDKFDGRYLSIILNR
ncbi:MAG: hypothetical protein K2K89_13140 [Ruminococcus sp.]|nr:hypothetical protein [Ruminococcus sp.]